MALLRQTKVSPVQASLGPKSDVRVPGRNITYVRIDFCRLIPGTYIRIWNITYISYVYTYLVHTPESEKKQTSVYLIKRKIKKKMLVLVYIPGT